MERFALKVDLSAFLQNVYEKVMILADMQWGTVGKAEKRIRKMFSISCDIGFKSEEGYYLPSEEPIEILKHVEVLIAFEKNIAAPQECDKTSKEEQVDVNSIKTDEAIIEPKKFVAKKRRNRQVTNELGFMTSTPSANLAKRLKSGESVGKNAMCGNGSFRISNINGPFQERISDVSEATIPKAKTSIGGINDVAEEMRTKFFNGDKKGPSLLKRTNEKNDSASSSTSKSHIFYNESGEELNNDSHSKGKNPKREILFICNLENSMPKKARVFRIGTASPNGFGNISKCHKNEEKEKSESVSIIENITLVRGNKFIGPDKNKSDTFKSEISNANADSKSHFEESMESKELIESLISCDESAVIELNDSENVSPSVNNARDETYIENGNDSGMIDELSTKKILSNAIELNELPRPLDILVFKIKLTNQQISSKFIGKCTYVNKRTKVIKLELMDCSSEINKIPLKFACNTGDSIDLRILNIKMQELLEPKVFRT